MLRELAAVAAGLQTQAIQSLQLNIAWERRFRRVKLKPVHHRMEPMAWATFAAAEPLPHDRPEGHVVYAVSEYGGLAELLPDTYRRERVVRMLTMPERKGREAFLRAGLAALHASDGELVSGKYWVNLYR